MVKTSRGHRTLAVYNLIQKKSAYFFLVALFWPIQKWFTYFYQNKRQVPKRWHINRQFSTSDTVALGAYTAKIHGKLIGRCGTQTVFITSLFYRFCR